METVMEENIPSESTLLKHYNVPEEKCSQQISDSHIEEISRCGCKDWKSLSPHLEMENIVVEDIIRNSRLSEREKRHEFFLQWKDIKGSEATYQRLISALLKIKRRNDAELVCKLLQDSCSQSKQKPDPQPQSNTPQSHKVVSISAGMVTWYSNLILDITLPVGNGPRWRVQSSNKNSTPSINQHTKLISRFGTS